MNTLLILENDYELRKHYHDYVLDFKAKYDGNVIEFTNFRCKTKEEIFGAVTKATDIAVQTCFVNGSDNQFFEMVTLLSKFKEGKNVYIYLMGEDLKEFIEKNLEDKELWSISQHKIYSMSPDDEQFTPHVLLDFTEQVNRHLEVLRKEAEKIEYEKNYAKSSNQRTTGRKILVLGYFGHGGKAFQNLPIGETVDELDMSETDPNHARGVWIWGNGEAIKLINDSGFTEYKIATKLNPEEIIVEAIKTAGGNYSEFNNLELNGMIALIESDEDATAVANDICEGLNIPKRGNREKIRQLISENR
jgi:hypothetical protein